MRLRNMMWMILTLSLTIYSVHGQSPEGTIVGVVTESSHAAVPGAKVVITNQGTRVARDFVTNPEGDYTAPFLPVGAYQVSVEAPGFKKYASTNVKLETGQTVRVDALLEVGDVNSSVTVNAGGAQLLQTDTARISETITAAQITELPVANRYIVNILPIAPGVGQNRFGLPIDGGKIENNYFELDGVRIEYRYGGGYGSDTGTGMPLDSLEEVKINSSTSGSDIGLGTSVIALTTKSGTNEFHGRAFETYSGDFGQARSFFSASNVVPRFVRNQYGGSLGGPIRRNHTFFFVNIDNMEQRGSLINRYTVPTAIESQGTFSDYPVVLRDIASGGTVANQTPFPNNTIPSSRISPTATGILSYFKYPVSNLPGLANNLYQPLTVPSRDRQQTFKIDHHIRPQDNASVRLYNFWEYQDNPQAPTHNFLDQHVNDRHLNIAATEVHTFNPSIVNEFRFGYMNIVRTVDGPAASSNIYQALGITGITIAAPDIQKYGPAFSFGGVGSALGVGSFSFWPQHFETQSFEFNDTINIVRGTHSLRFGAQFHRFVDPIFVLGNTNGSITFTGSSNPASTGDAFADFLLGAPASSSLADPIPLPRLQSHYISVFAADDWKVTPRLTLNLALRYEYISPLTVAGDVNFSDYNPSAGAIVINAPSLPPGFPSTVGTDSGIPVVTSRSLGLGNSLYHGDPHNFGPRVGIAWRPLGKSTVFRMGYGIYYTDPGTDYLSWMTENPPWTFNRSYAAAVPFALSLAAPWPGVSSSLLAPNFTSFNPNIASEYSQQWNFTIQRALTADTALTVAYVGSKGTHLWMPLALNQILGAGRNSDGTLNTVRPVPQLNNLTTWNSIGNRTYNSLQVELRKRWSHGFLFDANWTWAKSIDDSLDQGVQPQNSYNWTAERADDGYTLRHVVNLNGIWDLPFGHQKKFLNSAPRLVDAVLGGWKLSGIFRWQSGAFYTPSFTNAYSAFGIGGSRPDRVAGVAVNSGAPPGLLLNPAAFSVPTYNPALPQVVFGNSARNVIIGPPFGNVDFSIAKSFRVVERQSLTVRIESFNAANHPNITGFGTNISSVVTVGLPSSASAPRTFQFSGRYDF